MNTVPLQLLFKAIVRIIKPFNDILMGFDKHCLRYFFWINWGGANAAILHFVLQSWLEGAFFVSTS
jgi:hypothetical protein